MDRSVGDMARHAYDHTVLAAYATDANSDPLDNVVEVYDVMQAPRQSTGVQR